MLNKHALAAYLFRKKITRNKQKKYIKIKCYKVSP